MNSCGFSKKLPHLNENFFQKEREIFGGSILSYQYIVLQTTEQSPYVFINTSCPFALKGFISIAICYMCQIEMTLPSVEGAGQFYCFVFIERAKGTCEGERRPLLFSSRARARVFEISPSLISFQPINCSKVSEGAQLRHPYFFPACLENLTQI